MKLSKKQMQLINNLYKTSARLNLQTLCRKPNKRLLYDDALLLVELSQQLLDNIEYLNSNKK